MRVFETFLKNVLFQIFLILFFHYKMNLQLSQCFQIPQNRKNEIQYSLIFSNKENSKEISPFFKNLFQSQNQVYFNQLFLFLQ